MMGFMLQVNDHVITSWRHSLIEAVAHVDFPDYIRPPRPPGGQDRAMTMRCGNERIGRH